MNNLDKIIIEERLKENIEEYICSKYNIEELTPEVEDMALVLIDKIKKLSEIINDLIIF